MNLKDNYDVPDEYEMLVPDSKDQVSEPPEGYIIFYNEAL